MANAPDSDHSSFWRRIHGKLLLLLVIMLVPTFLIQAYVYYDTFRSRRTEELQANLELARAAAKAFDSFLRNVLDEEFVVGLALTSSQPLSHEDQDRILSESQAVHSILRSISWVTPQGSIIASSNHNFLGIDITDRPYFQQIVAGREWTISDLLISKAVGTPSFSINRAVRGKSGELLGIVSGTVFPDRLGEILGVERSKGGAVSLVDSQGMLVYRHPTIEVKWEERDWTKLFPTIVEDALKREENTGSVFTPFEGKNRIFALAPVASIGWLAGAGRTEEMAMAAITSTLMPQSIIFLFITLAAFAAALILSRYISSP